MSDYSTDLFRTSCGATAPLELNISGPGWTGVQRRVFNEPFVLIGGHERNSLRLEDEAISRRHAYLQQLGGGGFCVDLGSRTGVSWAGESRSGGWLRPDQAIQIGPFTLELAMAAGAAGHEVAEESDPLQDRVDDLELLPCITVEKDDKEVAQMRMNRVLVLVGSSPACRVRLREAGVSKYHCSLLSTPEGVWMIDLLSETGTGLNGQPLRSALVEEGDYLQVGPYRLRFSYRSASAAPPSSRPSIIRAETPVRVPVLPKHVLAQALAEQRADPSATDQSRQLAALQAELDQAREGLRDAEILRQQLTDSQAECVQLRDRAYALEKQLTESAALTARLEAAEASVGELEIARAERDKWLAEAQELQTRLSSEATEREQWQQQLDEEREAMRALEARLEQESAVLGEVRAEFAARNAEYSAALERLQENQNELARTQDQARSLQAELDQTGERLRDAEVSRQQLADSQAECVRLRDQVRALEDQVAEAAALQSRLQDLEASARELEAVCAERDQWQAQTQDLQTRLASEAAEQEQWRQRFETAQKQLDEEREAVRELGARLDNDSAVLQGVRAEFADRNVEYSATVQRLQEIQDELARSQQEGRGLQAELTEAQERLRDADDLRQQLADTRAECVRLQALEASARELEVVCAERDQWRTETQTLQGRLASGSAEQEQLACLAAERDAARAERDRLHSEHEASLHLAEEAKVRVSDLERALHEATTADERTVAEARAGWESERQALQALLEQERQLRSETTQAAVRDVQVRAEAAIRDMQARAGAELQRWRKELEGAEAQIVCERGLFQEQGEQMRRQIAVLQADRDRLAAKLAQTESSLRAAEANPRNETANAAETEQLRRLAVVDQILSEFRGIQAAPRAAQSVRIQDQNKTTDQGRPR